MSEYIEKKAAVSYAISGMVRTLPTNNGSENWIRTSEVRKNILSIPAADVVLVVHARWVNYSPVTIKCSRCGHVIHDWRYSECKYCPNCGAKMDEGEEHEAD